MNRSVGRPSQSHEIWPARHQIILCKLTVGGLLNFAGSGLKCAENSTRRSWSDRTTGSKSPLRVRVQPSSALRPLSTRRLRETLEWDCQQAWIHILVAVGQHSRGESENPVDWQKAICFRCVEAPFKFCPAFIVSQSMCQLNVQCTIWPSRKWLHSKSQSKHTWWPNCDHNPADKRPPFLPLGSREAAQFWCHVHQLPKTA